jgi:DNA-directed RNA polymerase specialized sigma24 family protein
MVAIFVIGGECLQCTPSTAAEFPEVPRQRDGEKGIVGIANSIAVRRILVEQANCHAMLSFMDSTVQSLISSHFPGLHQLAARLLMRERANHTLSPTALVSESYLRLCRFAGSITSEEHLFRLASRVMSHVLIDYGRSRRKVGHVRADQIPEILALSLSDPQPDTRISLRSAFERLRVIDPKAAEVLWLIAVEGYTIKEVGSKQARQGWRVRADYDYSRDWLAGELSRY